MTVNELIEGIQTNTFPIVFVFAGIITISLLVLKRKKKRYESIPTKIVFGQLIKTTDYIGDTTADYSDYRQSFTVGKYEYWIDGKKYIKEIKTAYGGELKDKIPIYYKKGKSDASLEPNVTSPVCGKLLLVVYFAIVCPVLTVAVWIALKQLIGAASGIWH